MYGVKKAELPSFYGEDPFGFITSAETCLLVQIVSMEVKFKLAKLSLEGSTIHWFNLLKEINDPLIWETLKKAMVARFGGRVENPYEELTELKQIRSVELHIACVLK